MRISAKTERIRQRISATSAKRIQLGSSFFDAGPRRQLSRWRGGGYPFPLSVSFVPGFASSLSSTGLERWSLLISLAPTLGSTGVTLIAVPMGAAVHLK